MEKLYENLFSSTRLLQYQKDFLSVATEMYGTIKKDLNPGSIWKEDIEYYSDRQAKELIIKNFKIILNKYPDHFDCKFFLAKEYLDSYLHEIRYCSYSELKKIDSLKTKENCDLEKFADNLEQVILHKTFEYKKYVELLFQYQSADIFEILSTKFTDSLQVHISKAIFYLFLDDLDKARNEIKLSLKYGLNIDQFWDITVFYKQRLDGIYGYWMEDEQNPQIDSEFNKIKDRNSRMELPFGSQQDEEEEAEEKRNGNGKFIELLRVNNDVGIYAIHDNFFFGKHKGETIFSIAQTDLPYLLWCITNVDFFAVDFFITEFFIRDLPNSEKYIGLNSFKILMVHEQGYQESLNDTGPDDRLSRRDLERDNFDAMTDGNLGSYDDFIERGGDTDGISDWAGR